MVAGTVIKAAYTDLHGYIQEGLFLVIYDEAYDDYTSHTKNIIALKITSHTRTHSYNVRLAHGYYNFLSKPSNIMCSKPHVFHKADIEKVGHVSQLDLLNALHKFNRFQYGITTQMTKSFTPILAQGYKKGERHE